MTLRGTIDATRTRALDAFFESYYRLRPVNATFTGLHDHDHRLPDWSSDGVKSAIEEMRALRHLLVPNDADSGPETPHRPSDRVFDEIDCTLADGFLEIQMAEMQGSYALRRNPSLHLGEGIFGVVGLMLGSETDSTQENARRGEAIAARLRSFPRLLHDAIDLIGDRTIPALWMARCRNECTGAQQLFGNGVVQWCTSRRIDKTLRRSIEDGTSGALGAVHEFQGWLQGRAVTEDTAYGCGEDALNLLLTHGHHISTSRTALLGEAREQFFDARDQWDRMVRAVGGTRWEEIQTRLDNDVPVPAQYLPTFDDVWDQCRSLAEQHELVTWPEHSVAYRHMPMWARPAAPRLYFLNYRSPPPFDHPAVVPYFVPDMGPAGRDGRAVAARGASTSVIKLNHVVHHGALGHHVQNHHAYRCRSRIGQIAAVDCASRIGMFCGGTMAEGWACYATDLMEEVGFCTPLESVGLQQTRVRQLARAIVDIELHQGTMNAADARRFLVDQARMDQTAAERELTRISMFPGTGLMYWTGTAMIHRLRRQREELEGTRFSLRAFHDALLSFGSIPVALITRHMTSMGVG